MSGFRWARLAPLLLMTSATFLTLAGFEAGLRLLLPQKLYRFPRGLFREEPGRVYGLTPGFRGAIHNPEYVTEVRINALGFRGPEIGPKAAGVRRVLVLGDSFVSALNVDEAEMFTSVAQDRLRRGPGQGAIEVINAGTPGYGTWHELQVLHALAPVVSPDVVLLCVYVGNDLEENQAPRASMVRDGLLVGRRAGKGILPGAIRSWLQRNSMAYVFLWRAWDQVRPIFGLRAVEPLAHFKEIVSRNPTESIRDGYATTGKLLRELAESARGRFPVLVVLIPDELQVRPDPFWNLLRREGRSQDDFDVDSPSGAWSGIAREAGLPLLDLLPVFRAEPDPERLYMSLDGHLTRRGNEVAGEALARETARLLPGSAAAP